MAENLCWFWQKWLATKKVHQTNYVKNFITQSLIDVEKKKWWKQKPDPHNYTLCHHKMYHILANSEHKRIYALAKKARHPQRSENIRRKKQQKAEQKKPSILPCNDNAKLSQQRSFQVPENMFTIFLFCSYFCFGDSVFTTSWRQPDEDVSPIHLLSFLAQRYTLYIHNEYILVEPCHPKQKKKTKQQQRTHRIPSIHRTQRGIAWHAVWWQTNGTRDDILFVSGKNVNMSLELLSYITNHFQWVMRRWALIQRDVKIYILYAVQVCTMSSALNGRDKACRLIY